MKPRFVTTDFATNANQNRHAIAAKIGMVFRDRSAILRDTETILRDMKVFLRDTRSHRQGVRNNKTGLCGPPPVDDQGKKPMSETPARVPT